MPGSHGSHGEQRPASRSRLLLLGLEARSARLQTASVSLPSHHGIKVIPQRASTTQNVQGGNGPIPARDRNVSARPPAHNTDPAEPVRPARSGTYRSRRPLRNRSIIAASDLRTDDPKVTPLGPCSPCVESRSPAHRLAMVRPHASSPSPNTQDLFSLVRAAFADQRREALSDDSERASDLVFRWWRGQDLNLRPSGYEKRACRPLTSALSGIGPGQTADSTELFHALVRSCRRSWVLVALYDCCTSRTSCARRRPHRWCQAPTMRVGSTSWRCG